MTVCLHPPTLSRVAVSTQGTAAMCVPGPQAGGLCTGAPAAHPCQASSWATHAHVPRRALKPKVDTGGNVRLGRPDPGEGHEVRTQQPSSPVYMPQGPPEGCGPEQASWPEHTPAMFPSPQTQDWPSPLYVTDSTVPPKFVLES